MTKMTLIDWWKQFDPAGLRHNLIGGQPLTKTHLKCNEIGANMKTAVYTGSFDPITLGHLNVIERASRLVEHLVVGIGVNIEKTGLFLPEERIELVKQVTSHLDNVEVRAFEGLAVNFVSSCGTNIMIRGVRPLTDIAAEFTMMMANRQLNDQLETVFLMADGDYSHVSSTLIKQIMPLANDEQLARFVPAAVIPYLRAKSVN